MKRKRSNGLEWLEFHSLAAFPEVVHAVFTRLGGISEPPFDSLNVSSHVGDDPLKVAVNLDRIKDALQITDLVFASQVHGIYIASIASCEEKEIADCDGLVTRTRGIGLVVKHADCQAALFFDPTKKVIAAVHCGWRGSLQNIYSKTIDLLQNMGCKAKDILVCISPSLGPANSQFGLDSINLFPDYFHYFKNDTNHFDFWAISYKQLIDKGIKPQNIEIARLCTYENKADFFSYRREKVTGRNATVIAFRVLEEENKY